MWMLEVNVGFHSSGTSYLGFGVVFVIVFNFFVCLCVQLEARRATLELTGSLEVMGAGD